jgi:hypothetical protein
MNVARILAALPMAAGACVKKQAGASIGLPFGGVA